MINSGTSKKEQKTGRIARLVAPTIYPTIYTTCIFPVIDPSSYIYRKKIPASSNNTKAQPSAIKSATLANISSSVNVISAPSSPNNDQFNNCVSNSTQNLQSNNFADRIIHGCELQTLNFEQVPKVFSIIGKGKLPSISYLNGEIFFS